MATSDRLGSFFDAYGEYLRGERDYRDIPMLPPPDCRVICVCPICDVQFVSLGAPSRAIRMQHCDACEEVRRSGKRVSLPVARLIRR